MQPTEQATALINESPITLETMARGQINQLFIRGVSAILKNIRDQDTRAGDKRNLVLVWQFEGNSNRNYAVTDITMGCSCWGHSKPLMTGLTLFGENSGAACQEQFSTDPVEELRTIPGVTHALELDSFLEGAINEAWRIELQRVVANMRDLNTLQAPKRKITLRFEFAPSEDRAYAGVKISVKSCCSGHNAPLLTSILISRLDDGQITAYEQFIEQGNLFNQNGGK